MKNTDDIELTLERIAKILHSHQNKGWASAIEKHRSEIIFSTETTIASILAMYGGMGSLNDIVLYKDGQPLSSENTELDLLRTHLFQLCREYQKK